MFALGWCEGHAGLLLRTQIGYGGKEQSGSTLSFEEHEQAADIVTQSELFDWTLTHSIVPFSNVEPRFSNREKLLSFVVQRGSRGMIARSDLVEEITILAHKKMDGEWSQWVRVHEDSHFDEIRLDNMLMMVLYRFILNRDRNQCVLCLKCQGLTIHHIVRKQRNSLARTPPFGRSVPTNLVTLCRSCHSKFEPYILPLAID
jgi:5-methylcytosine-specific restriction endonuclease McrA